MKMIFLSLMPFVSLADLPDYVVKCEDYIKGDTVSCKTRGDGCVGAGWYSKVAKTFEQMTRVNAVAVCESEGYSGVSEDLYGGNYGVECRSPTTGDRNVANKSGAPLTNFGVSVSWLCVDPVPDIDDIVESCGEYSEKSDAACKGRGDGCVGAGWFSKVNGEEPHGKIDILGYCKSKGFESVGQKGGNWNTLCRFPGIDGTSNDSGGSLDSFGYMGTWQCVGGASESPTLAPTDAASVTPTLSPTLPSIESLVVSCEEFIKQDDIQCKGTWRGANCVGAGWYSKVNRDAPVSIDAVAYCQSKGYEGVGQFGGNYNHQCRFPGSGGKANEGGGPLPNLRFTVAWECVGRLPTTSPTMAPSDVKEITEVPTSLDCKAIDEKNVCDLFEECYWKSKNKNKGKCWTAPKEPKDLCVLSDRIEYSEYSEGCKSKTEKKPCVAVGCKWKNGKQGGCKATSKPKCQKADNTFCCKLAGCNIQDSGRKAKKCYKSGEDQWN